jgi:hypothetical protein
MSSQSISRRHFVAAIPLTVLATPRSLSESFNDRNGDRGDPSLLPPQQVPPPGFSGPFDEAEAKAVASSPMAQAIVGLHGKDYPCSEMILLAALRRFRLPENHLDAAAVFGGGVGKRDLCGLLTGGLMAVGLVAGEKYLDRAAAHQAGRKASNAYWDWWISRGDLHCMGPGTTHQTSEEFVRMTQRTAVKLEEVILGL